MPTSCNSAPQSALPPALSGHIPELDGLRGIAIAMVLVFHYFLLIIPVRPGSALAYALATGRLAWSGVDLFFVLSGFLIGGILIDARDSSNYFRVFYTRRVYRIVPLYILCLGALFLVNHVVSGDQSGRFTWLLQNQLPWWPHFAFLQNFWMAGRNTLGAYVLTVTWSLAVEEQFYLTLPLLIRILNPDRLVPALLIGIFAAPALRITLHAFWPDHALAWFALMPCRADALLLGVLGAVILRHPRWRAYLENNPRTVLSFLFLLASGCVCLTLRAPSFLDFGMLTVGFTWLALFYLTFLLYALTCRESRISLCLRWRWLGWLGAIAYGTYLLHEIVLSALYGFVWSRLPLLLTLQNVAVSVIALAVTLLICRLSWVYFERPLVQMGHRTRYRFENPTEMSGMAMIPEESSNA